MLLRKLPLEPRCSSCRTNETNDSPHPTQVADRLGDTDTTAVACACISKRLFLGRPYTRHSVRILQTLCRAAVRPLTPPLPPSPSLPTPSHLILATSCDAGSRANHGLCMSVLRVCVSGQVCTNCNTMAPASACRFSNVPALPSTCASPHLPCLTPDRRPSTTPSLTPPSPCTYQHCEALLYRIALPLLILF